MLKRWGRNESLSSFSFRCVLSKGSRAFALTVVDRRHFATSTMVIRSAEAFLLGTMQEEIWNAWNTKTDRALRLSTKKKTSSILSILRFPG